MKKNRKILTHLDPQEYEHPFDTEALNTLQGTPGLEALTKKMFEYGIERLLKVQYTGSSLKVNENNFPEISSVFREACKTIYLPAEPDLYIKLEFGINAFTTGVEKPLIVLASGTVDSLTDDELMFVVAHEVGHIKSNHTLYHMMAQVIPYIGQVAGDVTLGVGLLIMSGLEYALLYWSRMSELTADRAGLLACQDIDSAITAMVKWSGLPQKYYDRSITQEFIKQASEFKDYDYDKLNKVMKLFAIKDLSHPWTVMRAAELLKWTESGEYEKTLKRDRTKKFCPECGCSLKQDEKYCSGCGKNI